MRCGPPWCTTPREATTMRPRIPPPSSGRFTRTTPEHWAGATSPTTHWSTSTGRYSRPCRWNHQDVLGSHTGGFNRDVWGVSMIGDFEGDAAHRHPTAHRRPLIGLAAGSRSPQPGRNVLTCVGRQPIHDLPGPACESRCPQSSPTATSAIPNAQATRDTRCCRRFGIWRPGSNRSPDIVDSLRGGARSSPKWEAMGRKDGPLGAPTSPEGAADGDARYATFERGAIYWSPPTGAPTVDGGDLLTLGLARIRTRRPRAADQR